MERRSRRFVRALGIAVGLVILLGLGGAAYIALRWDRPQPGRPAASLTAPRDPQTLARGKYLYESTALCWSCHGSEGAQRPGEPQAGGKVFDTSDVGPGFGIYYGSNLTSDPETGIGSWTDGELVRALREGISRKGRVLFPIMPYEWLHGLSDQDTLAVVSYLRSLAPVLIDGRTRESDSDRKGTDLRDVLRRCEATPPEGRAQGVLGTRSRS